MKSNGQCCDVFPIIYLDFIDRILIYDQGTSFYDEMLEKIIRGWINVSQLYVYTYVYSLNALLFMPSDMVT